MLEAEVFTVRDLRQRTGRLIEDAEQGRLSLITKHGHPKILAMPFDDQLLELGVHRAMAVRLFEQRLVTLSQAAKIAKLSLDDFLDALGAAGVAAVDYPPEELDEEMSVPL